MGLARRPVELSTTEEVNVEVGHRFPAVGAVVDHDAVAVFRES